MLQKIHAPAGAPRPVLFRHYTYKRSIWNKSAVITGRVLKETNPPPHFGSLGFRDPLNPPGVETLYYGEGELSHNVVLKPKHLQDRYIAPRCRLCIDVVTPTIYIKPH